MGDGAPTATPSPLFRPQALEAHTGDRLLAEPLRLGTRWGRRAPLALVCVAAVAATTGLVVRVDERASGPVRSGSDGRSIEALLPAAAGPRLARGGSLDVDLPGGGRLTLRVASGDVRPIDAAAAERRFGRDAAGGLLVTSTALVLVESRLDTSLPAAERGSGHAGVVLDRRALLSMLLSGLLDSGSSG